MGGRVKNKGLGWCLGFKVTAVLVVVVRVMAGPVVVRHAGRAL